MDLFKLKRDLEEKLKEQNITLISLDLEDKSGSYIVKIKGRIKPLEEKEGIGGGGYPSYTK